MSDIIESQRWSDDEVARLVEHGPKAFMANTERSWHSVRSKYNYLKRKRAEREMKVRPSVAPVAASPRPPEVPEVTQVVGVQAAEKPDIEAIKARHRASFKRVNEIAKRKLYHMR